METLKSLAGMLHTLPHTEAVNATCAELDAADRQALKTVTKHVLRQLLEEVSAALVRPLLKGLDQCSRVRPVSMGPNPCTRVVICQCGYSGLGRSGGSS